MAGSPPAPSAPLARDTRGRFSGSAAAREAGRRGGLARAERDVRKWARKFGLLGALEGLPADTHIASFLVESRSWYVATAQELALIAGGELGPMLSQPLVNAAWQRTFSSFLFACATRSLLAWNRSEEGAPVPRTDLVAAASRLGDSARQNVLTCFELASRFASVRRTTRTVIDWTKLLANAPVADDDAAEDTRDAETANGPASTADGAAPRTTSPVDEGGSGAPFAGNEEDR